MALDVFEFYRRCLVPLTPPPQVSKLLDVVMQGGETTNDFVKVLSTDSELDKWLRLTVQRLGFERVRKLEAMITMLGQDRVRDLIIGRHIERAFVAEPDTVLGKLKAKAEADKAKKAKDSPKKKEKAPVEGKEGEAKEAEAKPEEQETIPNLTDFQAYLACAQRAEEVCVAIRNSYPGQAFAGGVVFDYLRQFLKSLKIETLTDSRLKKTDTYLNNIFDNGLRCGLAANEITQKISIHHQKNVFVTALVHNVGKALLLAYDPIGFEKAFVQSTGADKEKGSAPKLESTEAEIAHFEWDHAQAGSLYLGRLPFLAEIERSVDYHHNPHLLRFSNPSLYALACVLRISGALEKIYQARRGSDSDVERLPDSRIRNSEEFKFLRLNDADWSDIKANYALKLMKVGL